MLAYHRGISAKRVARAGRSRRSLVDRRWLGLAVAVLLTSPALLLAPPASATNTLSVLFSYNGSNGSDGSVQNWVVPTGVTHVTIAATGAAGAPGTSSSGIGGRATAAFTVTPGETLRV